MKAGDREVVSAFTAYLGVDLEEATDGGYVRLALQTADRHTKLDGGVHEGVVLTMMDSALGMAIRLKRGIEASESEPHATIDMNASFIRAVRPGDRLIVEGRVKEAGDVVMSGEAAAVRQSDGELVATSRLTFVVQQRQA